MLKKLFHHASSQKDCARLCCTKIENFGVKAGRLVIFEDVNIHVHCGQLTAIIGPNGAGKSTLLRAIAGIWPYGTGEISLPTGWRTMFLPQRPYLPLGSLRRAIYYPQPVPENTDDNLTGLLERFGLQNLAGQLDAVGDWSRILSLGEQQRLAFIRILLLRPDIVFLDESTSALDEPREAQAYEILHQLLPQMAVVSVGHRSSLLNCHDKQLVLAGDGYWKLQDIK